MMKGLSKSDVKYRKKRVKVLPFSQRFLYRIWVAACISFIFLIPITLMVSQYFVMNALYIPEAAVCVMAHGGVSAVLVFAGLFIGVVISIGFSYLTYSEKIKKVDLLYSIGSFQSYPKTANVFICFFLVLIMFPVVVFSYNSYTFCTEEEIVVKSAFAFTEKTYQFSEVTHITKKVFSDGKRSYFAHTERGKEIKIFYGKEDEAEGLIDVFQIHHLTVT